jgi:hypothetical protein
MSGRIKIYKIAGANEKLLGQIHTPVALFHDPAEPNQTNDAARGEISRDEDSFIPRPRFIISQQKSTTAARINAARPDPCLLTTPDCD